MKEEAPQREHSLRAIFNALRWMVRAGCPWRLLPHDLPPWTAVHQQTLRWIRAGCVEAMAHDLRWCCANSPHGPVSPRQSSWTGAPCSPPRESGARAGYDGHKRRKGSKVHLAVDTLGHLLALKVTPANAQERAQVGELAEQVQAVTGEHVVIAYVDQGYTGAEPAEAAARAGIDLMVIKLAQAKRGFVLLPRRGVVERSFAWTARFRRLGRDDERLAPTFAGFHWLAFVSLMLSSLFGES
jgi:transposase